MLSWVFEKHNGLLPSPVFLGETGTPVWTKITSLRQLAWYYDQILEAMQTEDESLSLGTHSERTTHREAIVVNYSHPLPHQEMEAQSVLLTEAFRNFRGMPSDHPNADFYRRGWTKTFRIMLHKDQRCFDDSCW